MSVCSHFWGTIVAFRRHRWVCLILALLLLYNPFSATLHTGSGLEVCHPASHRATVGSSELQQFTGASRQELLGFAVLAPAEIPFLLPALSELSFLFVSRGSHPPQQLFSASLWFRPPPAPDFSSL